MAFSVRRIPSGCSGYTLIETLVSIVILAVSVVVVLQVFSGGLRAGKLSENYIQAIQIAREKMETTLLALPLTEGVLTGDEGERYSWIIEVTQIEYQQKNDKSGVRIPIGLYAIQVEVSWLEGLVRKKFDIATTAISPVPEKRE